MRPGMYEDEHGADTLLKKNTKYDPDNLVSE